MVRRNPESASEAERLDASQRTLAALEVLARHPSGVTPKELSRELGLHLSTCYRLLNTLVAASYAVRSPGSGLFRLAKRVAYLHHGYLAALSPLPGAVPFVHALESATGESAMLYQFEGDDCTATVVAPGSRSAAFSFLYVGMGAPAHAVAAGRVLLAGLSAAELDAYLARWGAAQDSPFPLADPEALRASLKQIRQAGYALDWGEGHPESCCVAAPVADPTGTIDAAIGLLLSCKRLRQDESALIAAILAAAQAIQAVRTAAPARDEHMDTDQAQPEAITRAEIEASIATLAEIMSRVG